MALPQHRNTMARAAFERHLSGMRAWLNGTGDAQMTMSTLMEALMSAHIAGGATPILARHRWGAL